MKCIILFAVLLACVLADNSAQPQYYSYSSAVGSGSGSPYSLEGEGHITAVRVWDRYGNYIYGFQFRYGDIWSKVVGFQNEEAHEIELFDDEVIVQVSGKYSHYVQSVVFVTSRGRMLQAGQPSGRSFNMYASNSKAELRFISGRYHGGITSIGAHWAVVAEPYKNSTAPL